MYGKYNPLKTAVDYIIIVHSCLSKIVIFIAYPLFLTIKTECKVCFLFKTELLLFFQ